MLIVSDDQPLDSMKAMPFLTSKPGGHWIDFTNAFDQTPLCCPSRASILTGLYPHHHGVEENDGTSFDPTSTIATWLDDEGYRTGLAGKYLNGYPFHPDLAPPAGWDDWLGLAYEGESGGDQYGYTMNDNGSMVTYGTDPDDYQTDVIARRADSFIRSGNGDPFFFYAAPRSPHAPLTPPARYASTPFSVVRPPNFNEADVSDKPEWVKSKPPIGAKAAKSLDKDRVAVYRMVRAIDDLVATIYQALAETGALDNTVIMFLTDNGFMRGEHRHQGKACVYEECIRTPLFVRVPWLESRTESAIVANIDVAPTLAEFAGTTPASPVDGESFVSRLNDASSEWRENLLLEYQAALFNDGGRPMFWGVRTPAWKYAELETGEKELYDMLADPYELVNRAGDPLLEEVQARLADELAALKAAPPQHDGAVVSIADVSAVVEGDDGTTIAPFTISLSEPAEEPTAVSWSTADGTAVASSDYETASGTATFLPGEISATVSVNVFGDAAAEDDETFTVNISSSDVLVVDPQGLGTILDDDTPPSISISDVSLVEGTGVSRNAVFTVTLSPASDQTVSVSYATVDGTAKAPGDFAAATGVLHFAPGETVKTVEVSIVADALDERTETFTVALSGASGATIADASGRCAIQDDD